MVRFAGLPASRVGVHKVSASMEFMLEAWGLILADAACTAHVLRSQL